MNTYAQTQEPILLDSHPQPSCKRRPVLQSTHPFIRQRESMQFSNNTALKNSCQKSKATRSLIGEERGWRDIDKIVHSDWLLSQMVSAKYLCCTLLSGIHELIRLIVFPGNFTELVCFEAMKSQSP